MKHIKIENTIFIMKDNNKNELLAEIYLDEYICHKIMIRQNKEHKEILNYIVENELWNESK